MKNNGFLKQMLSSLVTHVLGGGIPLASPLIKTIVNVAHLLKKKKVSSDTPPPVDPVPYSWWTIFYRVMGAAAVLYAMITKMIPVEQVLEQLRSIFNQ